MLDRADGLVDSRMGPFLTKAKCYLTPHLHSRKLLQKLLPHFFPYEFADWPDQDTFGRIEENIRNHRVTIVGLTHFDEGEVLSLVGMFTDRLGDDILANDFKTVVPASYHQRKVGILGWLGNVDMAWVVNEDTMKLEQEKRSHQQPEQQQRQKKKKRIRLGMGLKEYTIKARKAAEKGGLVLLALQAGRRSTLGQPVGVLHLLLKRLEEDRPGIDYDIVLLGSALRDPVWSAGDWEIGESIPQVKSWRPVKSYEGREGFNRGCLHEFKASPIVSRQELMKKLGISPAESGLGEVDFERLKQVDELVFNMIREHRLVDDVYL